MKHFLSLLVIFGLLSCALFPRYKVKYDKKDIQCKRQYTIYEETTLKIKHNGKVRFYCNKDFNCFDSEDKPNEAMTIKLKEVISQSTKEIRPVINHCYNSVKDINGAEFLIKSDVVINEKSSLALAIISSLTLTLIPAYAEMDNKIHYEIVNLQSKKSFKRTMGYTADLWIQLFLLPLVPFNSNKKYDEAIKYDGIVYMLKDIEALI